MDDRICASKIDNVRETAERVPKDGIFPAKTRIYARTRSAA
jgi:hypothetical protein